MLESSYQHGNILNEIFQSPSLQLDIGGSSSSRTESEVYHGSSPFSEPEARAVRDAVLRTKPHVFFDLHSYSQLWLTPWAAHRQPVADPLGREIVRIP